MSVHTAARWSPSVGSAARAPSEPTRNWLSCSVRSPAQLTGKSAAPSWILDTRHGPAILWAVCGLTCTTATWSSKSGDAGSSVTKYTNTSPSAVTTGHENCDWLHAFAAPGPLPSQKDAAPLISVGAVHV